MPLTYASNMKGAWRFLQSRSDPMHLTPFPLTLPVLLMDFLLQHNCSQIHIFIPDIGGYRLCLILTISNHFIVGEFHSI